MPTNYILDLDLRQPPIKMVAQCPGPYETAQGVTHTTSEIFGSGGYVLQIAAARARNKTTRPGLDISSTVDSSSGFIHSSVPTVAVSNTSLDGRLNYTLSVRVWPPQAARPLGTGCGWSVEDTLGAVFTIPVMEFLALSQPPEPFAGGMSENGLGKGEVGTIGDDQQGPTRTRTSFHADGGVYLSEPLLMMPPSSLAGRNTGFYLRLHLRLEAA